jgi:hypothetical protein
MKYVEAYDMVLPSDRKMMIHYGRMAIDQRAPTESNQSMAYYGVQCDESHSNYRLDQTEVLQLEKCSPSKRRRLHNNATVSGPLVCSSGRRRLFLGCIELRRSVEIEW